MKEISNDVVKGLISVIIPNYNHEKYLVERIESVLCQTYQNIEIIILDDCSTDNSLAIINQYKNHNKVQSVLVNKINSGSPFKQWKFGVSLSRGEYIWIAESDDYSGNEFLKCLVNHHKNFPTAGIVYTNSYVVDENSQIIDNVRYESTAYSNERWDKSFFSKGFDEVKHFLVYRNTIPNVSSVLFKRKAIIENIDFIQKFQSAGDYMIYARILLDFDVFYEVEKLNYFRSHEISTREFNKKNITRGAREALSIKKYIAENFSIDKMTFEKIKNITYERKEYFFSKTEKRIEDLLNNIRLMKDFDHIVVSPYNEYSRLISDYLIEHDYKVSCFIDRKNFDSGIVYKNIPVIKFNDFDTEMIKNSVVIIATDRYKDVIHKQLNDVCTEYIKPIFF